MASARRCLSGLANLGRDASAPGVKGVKTSVIACHDLFEVLVLVFLGQDDDARTCGLWILHEVYQEMYLLVVLDDVEAGH